MEADTSANGEGGRGGEGRSVGAGGGGLSCRAVSYSSIVAPFKDEMDGHIECLREDSGTTLCGTHPRQLLR